jgi:SSS family solute:Na+ symporter
MYGLFWKRATAAATWASFAIGTLVSIGNIVFGWMSPINAGALSMVASLLIFPVVSLLTPAPKKETVAEIFSCYEDQVTIQEKYALPEQE